MGSKLVTAYGGCDGSGADLRCGITAHRRFFPPEFMHLQPACGIRKSLWMTSTAKSFFQIGDAAPAVQASLDRWHAMLLSHDLQDLPNIVHPDAVFRSPVGHSPYVSSFALCFALNTVIKVFRDFTYHRSFISADGHNAVLEFSAMVGDKSVKGIDMVRFDDKGLITDFEVMIRPLNGLQALAAEMGARVAGQLNHMKKES